MNNINRIFSLAFFALLATFAFGPKVLATVYDTPFAFADFWDDNDIHRVNHG